MDISIDMLSIGNADNIIVWLKNEDNSFIVVIDGGNPSDGEKVEKHLEKYILPHVTQSGPNLIISTHPDKDHIGGLTYVVQKYSNSIDNVLVHDPALHTNDSYYNELKTWIKKHTLTDKYKIILESLNNLSDFIKVVDSYDGIIRTEPFTGVYVKDWHIEILGPSEPYYENLLPDFRDLDKYFKTENEKYETDNLLKEIRKLILKQDSNENPCPIVDEENRSSAENDSSTIVQITAKNGKYIFTGDAGVDALNNAISNSNIDKCHWLDVPHHGSRRNLTSQIIKKISPKVAFISANGDDKHPRKELVECLKKHGSIVYSTHYGGNKWHHNGDFPDRKNYTKAEQL